jgi:branched-chain amino acid transport system substrate-binding protein
VQLIVEARPDAVYLAGYATPAAQLLQELRAAGSDAVFMGWEGVLDGVDFLRIAGDVSRGALVVGSFLPTVNDLRSPAALTPVDDNSRFSTEAYELTTILTDGIGRSGVVDRSAMKQFLDDFEGSGQIRRYAWDDAGELAAPELILYEVG